MTDSCNSGAGKSRITFEDFRVMAQDETLDKYAKVDSSIAARAGREPLIFEDIRRKVRTLEEDGKLILEIGPGCADLPQLIIRHCEQARHRLLLVDSQEMLYSLPDRSFIRKIAGKFPEVARQEMAQFRGLVDGIICYSVLHYVIPGNDVFDFFDSGLELLSPGGYLLIGDIPNASMRRRFFASDNGVRFHQGNMKTNERPQVKFNSLERDCIDDALVLALLTRARNSGFHAYVMPQDPVLPMANRREDLLIHRP